MSSVFKRPLHTLMTLALTGCATPLSHTNKTRPNPLDPFVKQSLVRGESLLMVTSGAGGARSAAYDNALAALIYLERGDRDQAGAVLATQARLQFDDGGLPFSVALPYVPSSQHYIRSGAMAWVGYATTIYLDGGSGGRDRDRDAIIELAHRIARYLLAHQVLDKKDPRFGLFTGGAGTYSQVVAGASLQEVFVADEITWAATEHNIDCYFFLRNLARITENREFTAAAERVKNSLLTTLWSDNLGTFARGMRPTGLDLGNALDCASWGALFLIAIGETEKAQRALQTAERDFASSDSLTGITGHKPYSDAEIFANRDIANYYRKTFPTDNWTAISGVWPEGSAGVALTAFRLGHSSRAVQILSELERLRAARGTLPDFTQAIPQEFDTAPSAAGTAWIELVRREIDQAGNSFLFK